MVERIARSEFILGGQKSGKSRRGDQQRAVAVRRLQPLPRERFGTAQPGDDEMHERIARHRRERAERVPGLTTLEEPLALADALRAHGAPRTLLVVDCLTLWLTNLLMPASGDPADPASPVQALLQAIADAPGPLVLVGNEIGLGVIPLGRETRAFVDALGHLNQTVAAACERVTLMAAGLPLTLKDAA